MKKTTKSYAIHGWWLQMVVVNFSFLFFDHSFSTTLMMMIIIIIIVACLLLYNNDYIRLWVCTIWNLWSFSFFFTDVIYFNIFFVCVWDTIQLNLGSGNLTISFYFLFFLLLDFIIFVCLLFFGLVDS